MSVGKLIENLDSVPHYFHVEIFDTNEGEWTQNIAPLMRIVFDAFSDDEE